MPCGDLEKQSIREWKGRQRRDDAVSEWKCYCNLKKIVGFCPKFGYKSFTNFLYTDYDKSKRFIRGVLRRNEREGMEE